MKFRLIESINYTCAEDYLLSNELNIKLIEKFGDTYFQQPICREVCNYILEALKVEGLDDSVGKETEFTLFKVFENYLEPISTRGHCVIKYKDRLYDYTPDQYQSYGFRPANGLRVMDKNEELQKLIETESDVFVARDDTSYVIIEKEQA